MRGGAGGPLTGHHQRRETFHYRRRVLSALEADNYDKLTVAEVFEKLDDHSAEELKKVREFEKRNKDCETLVERIDRKIWATS